MAIKLAVSIIAALSIVAIYVLFPASKRQAPEPLAQSGLNADKSPYLAASASASASALSNRTSEPTSGAQSSGAKHRRGLALSVNRP